MHRTAGRILWHHLGRPAHRDCAEADESCPCWICSEPVGPGTDCLRGQLVDGWDGARFTGQNRIRCGESRWACESCLYLMSRISPVPGRIKAGKQIQNFRLYSHVYDQLGGLDSPQYWNHSKGEKEQLRAFLRGTKRGVWWAAIADSGQKHLLPWCPVNPARAVPGVVLFEERVVALEGWEMLDDMAALLTAGCTKEELQTGRYGARAWQLCGDTLRRFESTWGQRRGGGWWSLCLWLAQRDEVAVAERIAAEKEERKRAKAKRGPARKAANTDGRATARAASSVPENTRVQPTKALGCAAESAAQRSQTSCEPGRVVHHDDQRAAAAKSAQLGLPGFD